MTQYLAVKFNENQSRTYTYANDGQPLAVGDKIEVPTQGANKEVTVHSVSEAKPTFTCKAIIGKVEPEAEGAGK